MSNTQPLLSIQDLNVSFQVRGRRLTAIRHVSLDIMENEVLAIIGESGSGKTVLTRAFSGLLAANEGISSGELLLNGKILSEKEKRRLCGTQISFVFQEPATALNPVQRVGDQIAAVIHKHEACDKRTAKEKAVALMNRVGIADAEKRYSDYPFQYSGGMLQRVVIAIALSCRPKILICDEATTSLDVSIQAQILQLLASLQKEMHFSMIVITHDFGVVARIADRVAVMYAGEIVEIGKATDVFYDARHPYTWSLLASMPQLARNEAPYYYLPGSPPNLEQEICGDPFAARNAWALNIDRLTPPPFFQITGSHLAKTWLEDPRAPAVRKPEAVTGLRQVLREALLTERPVRDTAETEVLLEVRHATIDYGNGKNRFPAVKDVSLELHTGEILALVGESGSGKTSLGKALAGFLPLQEGEILFQGRRISGLHSGKERRELHRHIQMVFQNQTLSLNDRMTAGQIISEGLDNFGLCADRKEKEARVEAMIHEVGLLSDQLSRYPHELSGGQRQRLGLARALILNPEVVIADEPVASLDVSIRAQILNLMHKFSREHRTGFLFISHDLSVVRLIADRVAVMRQGQIVEIADTEELFRYPLHPYTRQLFSAIPLPDPERERFRVVSTEETPSIVDGEKAVLRDLGNRHAVRSTESEWQRYGEMHSSGQTTNPLLNVLLEQQTG